jgi:hypothetical protein
MSTGEGEIQWAGRSDSSGIWRASGASGQGKNKGPAANVHVGRNAGVPPHPAAAILLIMHGAVGQSHDLYDKKCVRTKTPNRSPLLSER